jgi:hypothetical protein
MVNKLELSALDLWRLSHLDKTLIYRPQTDQELEFTERLMRYGLVERDERGFARVSDKGKHLLGKREVR